MRIVRETCVPRPEVLHGELDDAIFAADFGHVIGGNAPQVYQDPCLFFRNTHPAEPLRHLVRTVFDRLAEPDEAGALLRLRTGFGGGKTHALIALWHLARHASESTLGTDLLPAAGRPSAVAVAGFDGEKAGTAVVARHDGLETHSLWAELAWQLGGTDGYAVMRDVDDPEKSPDSGLIRDVLPAKPVLILLDEVVKYMAQLSEHARGCLLRFLGALSAEITARKQAVLVITDPAGQTAYLTETGLLNQALADARRLDDELGRRFTDLDPIGKESVQVIARRLFEEIEKAAADQASAEYHQLYQRVAAEHPGSIPAEAAGMGYADRIVQCYPFHPRLLEVAQNRLGALERFQKSRGTLRLFARILRDIWESESNITLISEGDLNWSSPRIQQDLLERLDRASLKAAVDADVHGHAGQLDDEYSTDIHRRVASALLLESLQEPSRPAVTKEELTLAVLRPTEVGYEPGEALDRLMERCWHTYSDATGQRYHFGYQPNNVKRIEERMAAPGMEENARQRVRTMAQQYFRGHIFTLCPFPSAPSAVPDTQTPKLVLADSEKQAQEICDWANDSDPQAKMPRRFRNAILAIAPDSAQLEQAVQAARRALAAEELRKEEGTGPGAGHDARRQLDELADRYGRQAEFQTVRAYTRVIRQGVAPVSISEEYLVDNVSALQGPDGQQRLKRFLDDKGWVYQPDDVLDVDLLVNDLVNGATPSPDHPGAVTASSVHERALSSPKLRLLMNKEPVRRSILSAVSQGRLVVRLPNGDVYDAEGRVTGPPGARRREDGEELTTLSLSQDELVAPPDAPCVADWLAEDALPPAEPLTIEEAAARKGVQPHVISEAIREGAFPTAVIHGETKIPYGPEFQNWIPPAPPPSVVTTWPDAIRQAENRPLLSLKLRATNPDAARRLSHLAQPLGATDLRLSVAVSGPAKDGGTVQFRVANVQHTHPLGPIDLGTRIARAIGEGGTFEASLELKFPEGGISNAAGLLEQASRNAGDGIELVAKFEMEENQP